MDGAIKNGESGGPGREARMEAIMAEHETSLLSYATRLLNNHASAQDVVQNVFIKLFRSWKDGTKPTKQLRAWLYRVTHNEAIDLIRMESRKRALHKRHAEDVASGVCPDGQNCPAEADERRTMVTMALRHLDMCEQQVVLLRMDQGLSYREIAEVTGRSEGNIGCILHHAVKKLSARLNKREK